MERRKTVLGIKAQSFLQIETNNEEEEETDFFESDTNDKGLTFSLKPTPALHPEINSILFNSHKGNSKITSFEEASPPISSFLNNFANFQIPPSFEGPLYFIPDHVMNEQYSKELDRFAKDENPSSEFQLDLIDAHINVLAQISIVKFFKGQKIDFSSFFDDSALNVIDSRISSLIHFCMSKVEDRQISSYHKIQSILDFVKTPSVAPISSLFPDFTLQAISHDLCVDLITMFPHHPLLPSLIDKFNSVIDPKANELLNLIPSDDDDTDFSDSFLDSIANTHDHQQPIISIPEQSSFNEVVPNALEISQNTYPSSFSIILQEPPSMVTYKQFICDDPNSSLRNFPDLFKNWILDIFPACCNAERGPPFSARESLSRHRKSSFPKCEEKYQSMPTSILIDSDSEAPSMTSEDILKIVSYPGNINELHSYFNSIFSQEFFPLNYPIVHRIYADPSVLYKPRNFIYPNILECEFKGHKIESLGALNDAIDRLKKFANIPSDKEESPDVEKIEIKRFPVKRDLPTINTELPKQTVQLLALCDIEFLLNYRSPLTFDHSTEVTLTHKDTEREIRGKLLFNIYEQNVLPPYLAFRAAVALSLNLNEKNPSLAVDFLFEGIYELLYAIPQMIRVEFVRNAILYFAELLEKSDRYYYSSLLFDVFYLSDPNDIKHSNEIGLLCQKNSDIARMVFHFTQSMKNLINESKTDEVLYLAQVLSAVYREYSDFESPISILSYLLKDSYNFFLPSNKLHEVPLPLTKSATFVQPKKIQQKVIKTSHSVVFKPAADQLNTILSGTSLCEFLIKTKHFSHAQKLLSKLQESNGNSISTTLLSYVEKQSLIKKNLFMEFLNKAPEIQFRTRRNSPNVKLSFLAAANFDNSLATVRLLMKSYLQRELFRYSLVWSEAYIAAQTKLAVKEIGYGYLMRGISLYQAIHHIHSMSPPYSLYALSGTISSKQLSFIDEKNKDFNTYEEVLSEALSSLKSASIYLDKVGSQKQLSYSYLLYVDLLLVYFFDSEFEKLNNKSVNSTSIASLKDENDDEDIQGFDNESDSEFLENDNDNNETGENSKSIVINEPVLKITINNFSAAANKSSIFPSFTINKSDLFDELKQIFRRIDSIVTKCMNLTHIIYYQVLLSKYFYLQKKIVASQTTFDYAFSNMKKYFFCGDELIADDLSLSMLNILQITMTNMCILLLFYEKNFINDRLIAFDWLRSIQTLYQHQLRVISKESQEPLESKIDVSITSLTFMKSLRNTDFIPTLEKAGFEDNKSTSNISKCLLLIDTNMKLFETGKKLEEDMQDDNKSLCEQIEQIANEYRHTNEFNIPIDFTYSYVSRMFPLVQEIIYLQHLNDSIFIYRPSDGLKKRILLTSMKGSISENSSSVSATSNATTSTPRSASINSLLSLGSTSVPVDASNYSNPGLFKGASFSTMTNKGDLVFNSTSDLFPPKFIELIALFLMCDKKQRHDQFNSRMAQNIFIETKNRVFGNLLDDLKKWNKEAMADKHFFGENRIFGKALKGQFCSIKISEKPAIFITSTDLNSLPIEMMFPDVSVIRVRSYSKFIIKPNDPPEKMTVPKTTIFRVRQNPMHMMKAAIGRSKDIITSFVTTIGGDIPQLQCVFENNRSLVYPFSLFSSNNSDLYYTDKFTFADIIEIHADNSFSASYQMVTSKLSTSQSSIFLFTYSDLAEMPLLLEKVLNQCPFAYSLFIPAQFVREAFQHMSLIFERHSRRIKFIEEHPDDKHLEYHKIVSNSLFNFVVLLQATLMQLLDCPVPLFVPSQ